MKTKPENLMDRIKWSLAITPVSKTADYETKKTHKVLRAEFNMNPDIYKRGDA